MAAQRRRDSVERFSERYSQRTTEAGAIVEREAIGANVGANGFTTVKQADMLARRLALDVGSRLLDIGCGRGWPGLYIAKQTGCQVFLTDVAEPALRVARDAAGRQNVSELAHVVAASATELPFTRRMFDAVCHSDVL